MPLWKMQKRVVEKIGVERMMIDLVIGMGIAFLGGLNIGIILMGFFITRGDGYETVA